MMHKDESLQHPGGTAESRRQGMVSRLAGMYDKLVGASAAVTKMRLPEHKPGVYLNAAKRPATDEALLVFFHAQRTGGSFFKRLLRAVYGDDRVYAQQTTDEYAHWQHLSAAELDGYAVYAGHANYIPLRLKRPLALISIVRHPVYRAASLYFYSQKKEGHSLQALANRESMEDFYRLACKQKPAYMSNVQCRRICGKPSAKRAIKLVRDQYLAVGEFEHLPTFIAELGEVLGWPTLDVPPVEPDADRYDGVITSAFREMVEKDNKEDMALYTALFGKPRHAGRA